MSWMGGLRGDPTLRKEVKNDYKKGQSHERRESMHRIRRRFANLEAFLARFWWFSMWGQNMCSIFCLYYQNEKRMKQFNENNFVLILQKANCPLWSWIIIFSTQLNLFPSQIGLCSYQTSNLKYWNTWLFNPIRKPSGIASSSALLVKAPNRGLKSTKSGPK